MLTAFFSAAGLALRHISWVRLEEALQERQQAARAQVIRDHYDQWVVTTATLRLLANLGVLLCVVYAFLDSRGDARFWPLLAAFGVSAVILFVCSVAIPHAWGKHAGTQLLVSSYHVLRVLETFFWPVAVVFGLLDSLVRRLAGVSLADANGTLENRQEELLSVVEEGEKEGVVDEEEKEMIASVLEFRDTTVGEIMTPRTDVVAIEAVKTVPEAVEIIHLAGHSRFPVYEESIDRVVGMLYAKDLLAHVENPSLDKNIRTHLRKPFFVPESKCLRDLLHDFQNQKVHMAVVLDEYGGTAGIVTIEDILEELVGEIADEYETPQAESIQRIDEHTVEIDARVHVDELNDEFNLSLPEDEDYETVGGFAFSVFGHIPQSGEMFQTGNLQFTVIEADERKITRLRMVVIPEELQIQKTDKS